MKLITAIENQKWERELRYEGINPEECTSVTILIQDEEFEKIKEETMDEINVRINNILEYRNYDEYRK